MALRDVGLGWGGAFARGHRRRRRRRPCGISGETVTDRDEVGLASDQFYAALNHMTNGDAGPMMDILVHTSDVTTMHPIGGREVGWEQVRGPWEQVASMASTAKSASKTP